MCRSGVCLEVAVLPFVRASWPCTCFSRRGPCGRKECASYARTTRPTNISPGRALTVALQVGREPPTRDQQPPTLPRVRSHALFIDATAEEEGVIVPRQVWP